METLFCDCCGQAIEKASDGWIQWMERWDSEKNIHYSHKAMIVHKNDSCRWDRSMVDMNDLELSGYFDQNGLERLKEHFRQTALPENEANEIITRIRNASFKKNGSGSSAEKNRRLRERGKVTKGVRYSVLRRDGFQCAFCGASGKEAKLVVDHIIPIARGGNSDATNLQTLCSECNAGKGAKP